MHGLFGAKGIGWMASSSLKSCSQQINVQMELVVSGVPGGFLLGLLNLFINDVDSSTECTLRKFSQDTKLSGGAADLLEGGNVI